MLDWLVTPEDFAAQLREAGRVAVPERVERLMRLSQFQLDFLQTIQLNRAMDAVADVPATVPRHRLAIVGSTTLEHLAPGIRVAGLRRGLWIDIHTGGYGQYRHEVVDAASALRSFRPNTILFSIAATHALPDVAIASAREDVDSQIDAALAELVALWRCARQELSCSVIQQTFLDLSEPVFGSFDRLVPGSPATVVDRLNHALTQAALTEGVALLDMARASQRDGRDKWHDPARMLQAKQEIAPQATPAYGDLAARVVCAQRGLSKKCLVLDLDNTLWGGVLGDDGIEGLVLGQGSAAGEAYLNVQRYARQLKERGVILAVCSKNDPELAQKAFASHPEMLLRPADIAAFVANWQDKAANLVAIARQLNIGLDSLVFLDDNPAERARIREALPSVAVPELPADVTGYVSCLAAAGYFEATSFTSEDAQRDVLYQQNAQREASRASTQTLDEFLHGLQMQVGFGPFAPIDMPRITQLINKTNQFNPTTRRYTAEQVQQHVERAGSVTLQFRLADRFGDNGLVSAMILAPVAGAPAQLEIDTWVMSCRVFGRQLEQEIMNIAVETARRGGIRELVATYAPTPKNGVIRDLYPSLGFRPTEPEEAASGSSRWSLALVDYAPRATHITRQLSP
jgi:FkbH-like protein